MGDEKNYGQDAVKAYNKSINQKPPYGTPNDQGSGPSSGPAAQQPVWGTHQEGGMVVQDPGPFNRPYAQDVSRQKSAEQTSASRATRDMANNAANQASVGKTNVQYTKSKGVPKPKKRK